MSLITWNPDDKTSGITLSNNNLTATIVNHSNSCVRSTKGIDPYNEKVYFEVKINSTTHPNICFIGLRTLNSLNFLGGFYNFGDATSNRIVGIAIKNGVASFYKDGIFNRDVILDTEEFVYPSLSTGSISMMNTWIGTANFGTTKFDIVTSNPEAWNQLVNEGYLPYDIENASWFPHFKLNNINISKTNIFNTETGDIELFANISSFDDNIETNILANYTISVNNFILTDIQTTPFTLNATIPKSELNIGENLLTILLENEDYATLEFNYNLIVEDKNTIKAIRKYDFSSQFTHDLNKTSILLNNGAFLDIVGQDTIITTDNSNINTTGRKTIQNIVVNGNEDIIEDINVVEDMINMGAVGSGYVWEKDINLDLNINSINVI